MAKEWDDFLDLLTLEELQTIHPDAPRNEQSAAMGAGAFARLMENVKGQEASRMKSTMERFIRACDSLSMDVIAAAIDRRIAKLK